MELQYVQKINLAKVFQRQPLLNEKVLTNLFFVLNKKVSLEYWMGILINFTFLKEVLLFIVKIR